MTNIIDGFSNSGIVMNMDNERLEKQKEFLLHIMGMLERGEEVKEVGLDRRRKRKIGKDEVYQEMKYVDDEIEKRKTNNKEVK